MHTISFQCFRVRGHRLFIKVEHIILLAIISRLSDFVFNLDLTGHFLAFHFLAEVSLLTLEADSTCLILFHSFIRLI